MHQTANTAGLKKPKITFPKKELANNNENLKRINEEKSPNLLSTAFEETKHGKLLIK